MKIAIDIRNIGKKRTGDEVVFFNLVKSFALLDSQNEYFLCTAIADPVVLAGIADELGLNDKPNFQIISLKNANRFVWNFWTLPRYLRQNPADIYLTQYITPWFVPKKTRMVTIIHDVSFNVYGRFIKFSDRFFLKILIPLSLKRADRIIGVSEFTHDEILKYYNIAPEKVSWIHNAAGDNFRKEISAEEIAAVKKKYALPDKFILYVGTLQPRKNLPLLIEAYAKLPESMKTDTKLVLAGGQGYNYDRRIDETIEKYSSQKDVILPGFVGEEDKPALFRASQLFCNPSLYEGFGITVLEAMALGIPVLASAIPPHQEVAGDNILYFSPNDPEELAQKINSALIDENLRKALSQKGSVRADQFSWKTTAQKMLEIFENLHKSQK